MRFLTDEDSAELLMSQLWDRGSTGMFQTTTGEIVAGFDSEAAADAVAAWLCASTPVVGETVSVDQAPTAADLAVDEHPKPVTFANDDQSVDLLIRAGGAFGHGGHHTTRLAADLLLECLRPNQRILDVGTGTGILAILAAKAGAGSVVGIDNDPLAVEVANENAATNAVTVSFSLLSVAEAAKELGGPKDTTVDVVVMNVLLPVHRALASEVMAAADQGLVITAGYLSDQADELLSLYAEKRSVVAELTRDGWSAHILG